MRNILGLTCVIAAAIGLPGVASAATITDFNGSFGSFSSVVTGSFSNSYTFDVSGPGFLGASLTASTAGTLPALNFTNVTLNGTALTPGTVGGQLAFGIRDLLTSSITNTLLIEGTGNGSFGGSVSFQPFGGGGTPGGVPEPATWAMLISGLGAVGAVARRRRNTRVRVTFA